MINHIELKYTIPEVQDFGRRPTTPKCIACLLYLLEKIEGNVVEIGAWYGKTTYELATRFPDKTFYTIDYIEEDLILDPRFNKALIKNKEDLCKYAIDLPNVQFFYEDSKRCNFNKFNNVTFFFVDGDHSYEGIKFDTEKCIKHLKKNKGGIIAWHDIRVYQGIKDYLTELSKKELIFFINNCNIGFMLIGDYK